MTQTALHATFGRNLPAEKLGAALTLLQEHGRITSETRKTSGRPSVVWRLNEEKRINEKRDTSFFFLRKKEDHESHALALELAALARLDVNAMLAGRLVTDSEWSGFTGGLAKLNERHPDKAAEIAALVDRVNIAASAAEGG